MAHHRSDSAALYRIQGRLVIELIGAGLLVYLLVAGFAGLGRSLHAMQHANVWLLVASMGMVLISYGAAALTYMLLAARAIPFFPTFIVQISGGLVNRLLPAGLGGLGINALYLHRQGHTASLAAVIVASNNVLGFAGNAVLLGIVIAVSPLTLDAVSIPHIPGWILGTVLLALTGGSIYAFRRRSISSRARHGMRDVGTYFSHMARRPGRSIAALATSAGVTSSHTTALCLVLAALHYPVMWPVALVAISAGAFMGAAVPTPGGLGGAEAGIAAALITLGVPAAVAAAAALVYRGLTYWLPLVPGYLALRIAKNRYL